MYRAVKYHQGKYLIMMVVVLVELANFTVTFSRRYILRFASLSVSLLVFKLRPACMRIGGLRVCEVRE